MRKSITILACLLAIVLAVVGIGNRASRAAVSPVATVYSSDNSGFDVSNMDKSVSACTNFFQYANGGWVAKNPIPAAYPSWGRFNQLADKNQEQLRQILEDAAKNTGVDQAVARRDVAEILLQSLPPRG